MRTTALTAAGLASVAVLIAGCSTATKEAPPSSTAPAVSPTEKAINTPPKGFSQTMNAADGKAALENQGYSVQINWGIGRQDRPLSSCNIASVDGLRGDSPPMGTTVYLTVTCP